MPSNSLPVTEPYSGGSADVPTNICALLAIGTELGLFTKRIARAQLMWPGATQLGGTVMLMPAQLAMLLRGALQKRRDAIRRDAIMRGRTISLTACAHKSYKTTMMSAPGVKPRSFRRMGPIYN